MTIKGPTKTVEADSHELETIRPYRVKPTVITQDIKPVGTAKPASRKTSNSAPPRPKSPIKGQPQSKFALPSRPAFMYREHSVEDYSDLFVDNDSIFDRRLNIIKVSLDIFGGSRYREEADLVKHRTMLYPRSYFIHQTSRVFLGQHIHQLLMAMGAYGGRQLHMWMISPCGGPDHPSKSSDMQKMNVMRISQISLKAKM